MPTATAAASKAIIASTEYLELAPPPPAEVTARSPRPIAHRPRPIHSLGPTLTPNQRSAIQASSRIPPEIVVSTSESGATDRAATWRVHPTKATPKPMIHQREWNRPAAPRRGWESSTVGEATAPRYLQRRPTFATNALASASSMPS